MENEFGILKQTFREFLKKIELHITMYLICSMLVISSIV